MNLYTRVMQRLPIPPLHITLMVYPHLSHTKLDRQLCNIPHELELLFVCVIIHFNLLYWLQINLVQLNGIIAAYTLVMEAHHIKTLRHFTNTIMLQHAHLNSPAPAPVTFKHFINQTSPIKHTLACYTHNLDCINIITYIVAYNST